MLSLDELCRRGLAALTQVNAASTESAVEIEAALAATVQLRDRLIDHLRRSRDPAEQAGWRAGLDQANLALSLIVGCAYPLDGVRPALLVQGQEVLTRLLADLDYFNKSGK
jgi:hypothetical protein